MPAELEDIQPPKPLMTFEQFMELVERENERKYAEFTARLDKLSERMHQECLELSERMHQECTELSDRMDRDCLELSARMDKDFSEMEAKLVKALEPHKPPTVEQLDLIKEITELKKENVELKKENATLRSQIKELWKLFTSFFEKKITTAGENWSRFFATKKDSTTESAREESSNSLKL